MRDDAVAPAPVEAARALATAAAAGANVEVRLLHDLEALEQLAGLFGTVWRDPDDPLPIHPHVLRALELTGNYLSGAFGPTGELVGGSVAFAAVAEPLELHSHITAVVPGRVAGGVGFALKLDQRAWALERDITRITWTFDPLIKRNAVFNLAKLGAEGVGYLIDVYGPMGDVLNAGDESDRLLAAWVLDDPAVIAALQRGERRVVADLGAGAPLALSPGAGDAPVRGDRAPTVRVQVPSDVEALRREHPALARAWRHELRSVLSGRLAAGGRLLGLDGAGDYVVANERVGEGR